MNLTIDDDTSSMYVDGVNTLPITLSDWDRVILTLSSPTRTEIPFRKSAEILSLYFEYHQSDETRIALRQISLVEYGGFEIFNAYFKPDKVQANLHSDCNDSDHASFGFAREIVRASIKNKIIIGHDLVRAFAILQLRHPWIMIRDTATCFPLMLGYSSCDKGYRHQRKTLRELTAMCFGDELPEMVESKLALEIYKVIQAHWEADILEHGMINHLNPDDNVFTVPMANTSSETK